MRDGLLVRTLDLGSFTGDAWAATGAQDQPTDGLELICTSSPVLWVAIPYDGGLEGSQPVTDTTTTYDARLVKRSRDSRDNEWTATTVALTDEGGPQRKLGEELRDRDIVPGQRFYVSFPSLTAGTAPFARVYITAGAKTVEGTR
jgi:hypothetical protein